MSGVSRRPKNTGRTDRFRLWFDFLKNTKDGPGNMRLLSEYFSAASIDAPEEFDMFLEELKRMLGRLPSDEKRKIATRYLHVLSPLCERIGLFEKKGDLDTLCFRITDPEGYKTVTNFLVSLKKSSSRTVSRIEKLFHSLLREHGYVSAVSGRFKHPFSVYKKLRTKGKRETALFDIFAFRIILDGSDADCFDVLNLLHDRFTPLSNRFKDYISIPKVNGYQSLHTVLSDLLSNFRLPVEVQIRTEAMHEFSEHGLASHWLYATDKKTKLLSDKERKLIGHMRQQKEHRGVYCFSPTQDLYALPLHATARHFAHAIHSDLERKATGASINGRKYALDTALKDGDTIRILTAAG